MHCKKLLPAAIAGAMLMIGGCDKSVESGNYRLIVHPSLGLVQKAKVRVYAADGKTLLGKGTTGTEGIAGMYPGATRGPLVLVVQSDAETSYYDESLGAFVNYPSGQVMRAIVPSPYGNYAVTPLTELAYRVALDQNLFPLTAGEVNTLNERIRQALAPELASIIVPPTILSTISPIMSEDTQANRYALRLAAMAIVGDGEARPALSVMRALGSDILDGVIDNLDKDGNALTTPYDPVTLVDDMNAALLTAAGNYAAGNLQASVPSFPDITLTLNLANIDDGSNFTGCAAGDSTLPDDFKGRSVNLKFERVDAASPYQEEDVVRFTFCSNGQLRLTNEYKVVANTFTVTPVDSIITQYRWVQNINGVIYEAVATNGDLYEVNVYGENGAVYFGRFN